mgnify:CR=1 FL=1
MAEKQSPAVAVAEPAPTAARSHPALSLLPEGLVMDLPRRPWRVVLEFRPAGSKEWRRYDGVHEATDSIDARAAACRACDCVPAHARFLETELVAPAEAKQR